MGFATAAPAGYADLCRREPTQCPQGGYGFSQPLQRTSYQAPALGTVAMTAARWKELDEVNISANERIRYVSDQAQYGVQDYWAVATTAGDCEDIALAKRQALLDRGWAIDSLRLALVQSPASGQHVVLVVATSSGDYVMDSRLDFVLPWQKADYAWEESQDGTGNWRVAGADGHAVLVAALAASYPAAGRPTAAIPASGAGELPIIALP
jgi:predicted transglutaminase-like cysteine proteinase